MFKKFSSRQKSIFAISFGVLLVIAYVFVYYLPNKFVVDKAGLDYSDTLPDSIIVNHKMTYGFYHDSILIETNRIKNGETMGSLLNKIFSDQTKIEEATKKAATLYNLSKIRVGNKWLQIKSKPGTTNKSALVYEIDDIHYLLLDYSDSIKVSKGAKEVTHLRKTTTGVITSSLWNAMKESNSNPLLAVDLSEIFAWSVDFFGIEKGDVYKVIYDEDYVDGVSVGISNIYAAYFKHKGRDYYGFKFSENGADFSYFDENGNSLRKAFLKAPLKFSRISSKFSRSRFHPVLKIFRPHHGIDYSAPTGTPVYTIGDGTVLAKGYDGGGGGNYVKIRHNSVYTTVYMHLSKFESNLSVGKHVNQGETIGYVGKTGLATGPHLDFRVYLNGQPVNPLSIESPSVEPIKSENMQRYKDHINQYKSELDNKSLIN